MRHTGKDTSRAPHAPYRPARERPHERSGTCFDVSSPQALTRGGGSDPVGIMSMVTYTEQHYGGDANRVYVTGASSGATLPRVQLWHGTTDTTLNYNNLGEEIKQWTNVLGVSQTPVLTDHPQSTWTRTRYGATGAQPPVEAISVQGQGHVLPLTGMAAQAIAFMGLDGSGPTTTGGTTTGETTTTGGTT